jgi:hypothetical protein
VDGFTSTTSSSAISRSCLYTPSLCSMEPQFDPQQCARTFTINLLTSKLVLWYLIIQSVPQRRHHFSITNINWLMMFRNNRCLSWESYETHKHKMRICWLLRQVVRLVTTGF